MNQTLATREEPKKSVMPLRIALLVLPSTQLIESELSTLMPELYASGLLSSSSMNNTLVKMTVDDFEDTSFEKQLTATINAIEQGKVVQLSTATQSLLMMPALKAAQMRIHPHAQLAAMQQSTYEDPIHSALDQAKRELATVSKIERHHDFDSQQQFSAVYQLITELATRTHVRNKSGDLAAETVTPLGPKQAKSHFWFTDHHQARVAAITFSNLKGGQNQTSFVLAQGTGFIAPKSLINEQRLQFVLLANNESQLCNAIDSLTTQLTLQQSQSASTSDLLSLMKTNLADYASHRQKSDLAAVLQAGSIDAMLLELNALRTVLPQVFTEQTQYKTPSGSYFTANPLGNSTESGLAFVYPGVGTVYADMLSELHQYFPGLFARLEREGDLKSMLQADSIYHLDAKVTPAMALGDLAIAGVGSSYLLTQLLVKEFAITPNFALGYSMGEASMWASLGVWESPHDLISKTQTDPLFTSAISGELTAVRQAWQLTASDPEIVWNSFVVRSPSEPIKALLNEYEHAYLAIIQGDTSVIAGCENQCRALLAELGKRGIAANRVTAMHTSPAMNEHANVVDFYHQPLTPSAQGSAISSAQSAINPNQIKFISAADLCRQTPRHQAVNEANVLSSDLIAQSIADTFCHTLDFTSLIHSAQQQGAKLFVELGADRQNCTLIDKIAKQDRSDASTASSQQDYPCCTIPVNAKGGSDVTSLLKALGQLISHGVPLSLQPLINGLNQEIALRQLSSLAAKHSPGDMAQSNDNTLLKGEV